MTPKIDTLNTAFAITNVLHFAAIQPGLPVAEICTPLATARVALHGGHVLAWQPAGQKQVLWVSKAAVFEAGSPVRGGVPVCWPWFGAVPGQAMHGFVRTLMWQVRASELDANGQVVLRLGIHDNASTRALWDHAFDLELVVTVGTSLTMSLVTRNTGDAPVTLTQALHTYFCTGGITQTTVLGLDGTHYLDKVRQFAPDQQTGPVRFTGETDRVYVHTTADCVIDDAAWGRRVHVAKEGSASTVVWNPWVEREKSIADMAPGEYQQMLCVETCNAGPDIVTLAAGESCALVARISLA